MQMGLATRDQVNHRQRDTLLQVATHLSQLSEHVLRHVLATACDPTKPPGTTSLLRGGACAKRRLDLGQLAPAQPTRVGWRLHLVAVGICQS